MSDNYNLSNKTEFFNIKDFILQYIKYWKWFVLSSVIFVILAFLYVKYKAPIYNMNASIIIKTDGSGKSNIAEASMMKAVGMDGLVSSSGIEDEIGTISSQTIMRKMISDLNLNTTYTLLEFPFDKSLYNNSPFTVQYDKYLSDTLSGSITFRAKVSDISKMEMIYNGKKVNTFTINKYPQTILTECGSFTFDKHDSLIKEKNYSVDISIIGSDLAAEGYKKSIAISAASKKSNIILLSIEDSNKQRGKDILDKLVELYNEDALNDKNKTASNSIKFIKERIGFISKDLDAVQREAENFKKENNLTDFGTEARIALETMGNIQEKNVELEVRANIIKMLEDYMKQSSNKYALLPNSLGLPESTLSAIENYNTIVLERNRLLRNTSETNPSIQTLNEQIDLMRQNVYASIDQVKKETLSTRRDWTKKENELFGRMKKMPTQEREFYDIYRQQTIKAELYIFLLKKLEESELTLASNTPKAKIIDNAYNIFKPVSPRKIRTLAAAFAIGMVIPFVIIFLTKFFKFKLSEKEELERITKLPVLGEICLDKSGQKAVVKDGITSSTAELFRLLRSNIQFLLKKDQKVILITSSITGEGKSFFTLNLALSYSLMKDKKVVIVGLDIRNPKLAEYVGIKSKNGITNYLTDDDIKLEDITTPLSDLHQNLFIVPAGPIPPNPSEILLSDKLDKLFDQLKADYDYILVDTAPVGIISDTFVLDRISDITIYLFRADYTNKSNLRIAEAISKDKKLKNLYIVMNGTSTKSAYGYGYGHNKKD